MSTETPSSSTPQAAPGEWTTSGDVPANFNPTSSDTGNTKLTDSDTAYREYTWSFGGTAPFFEKIFSATLNAELELSGKNVSIYVRSDDNATVTIDGIGSISSSLHRPASETYFNGDGSPFEGKFPVSISYNTIGGPWNLYVCVRVFDKLPPPPKNECMCTTGVCPLSTILNNGSVDFSQPFGGTPFAAGFPQGALRIYDRVPVRELFSGAGLRYVHPMTRKIKSIEGATVVIEDALHRAYTYENGRPAGTSVWTDNCVETLADGRIVEVLDDRTRITYGADGNVEKIRSPEGVELSVSQLGIELIADEEGDLAQVWSLTDGLLDVVKLSAKKFRVDWYKPADVGEKDTETGHYTFTGTPVKTFTFGDVNDDGSCAEFELLEERTGTSFSFHYSWRYDSGAKDWVFVRGNAGGADAETSTKEKVFSGSGASVAISEWKQSGNGAKTLAATETYAYGADGEMLVGRVVNGVSEYSATRVASGNGLGKIASETDRAGAKRNYEYDTHARVVRETLDRGYADLAEETLYTYADVPAGESADLRPRTIVHKIAGSIFKTETFSYDDDFENGKTETHSVTANGTTLSSETRYYPANTGTVAAGRVKYEIRADGTATFYEYSATAIPASVNLSSNLGYTKTETEGAWENGAFAVVPAKSTRIVRVFDTRGNETRTEKHVHTGEVFELVSWENKTYAPTHKVISTERSDGKTSSADYICTGAVWTIDENGVRTDNTFDAAKRLKTSTRRGARGDVVTTYGYDSQGRIISETQVAGTLAKTLSRTYDAFGELASETDALGNTTTYTKSPDGLTETVTFPDGGTRITVRNAHGETLSVTGTAVVAQYFVYGFENGLKTTCVFTGTPNGLRWEKTYVDAHGRTVKTARPGFGENVVLYTENTYAGTRLVSTASTGQPGVSYAHDALGNVVETTQSAEGVVEAFSAWRKTATQSIYEKDAGGVIWQKTTNVVSCSDAGVPAQTTVSKTQLSHLSLALESKQVSIDVRGNATTTTSSYNLNTKTRTQTTAFPQMTDSQTSVSVDGVVVSQSAPGGVSTSAVYDAFNRKISATDARGNVTLFAYDAGDRLVSQTQTLGEENVVTSFEYDAMNRQTRTVFADGTFVASAYDLRGNKVAEFGNASYPALFTFDALNQKTGMQTFRALAGTPEEAANLTGGDATAWSYDSATGLLLSKTDAAGAYTNYTYTETGLLASRTWARGIVTTYGYDAWNQLSATSYSDGTLGITQSYDTLGRIVSTTDAAGTTTFAYDAYGAKISEAVSGVNKTITRHYDSFGRSTGYSVGNTRKTTLSYDAASGRLVGLAAGSDSFAWEYLAGTGLKSKLTYPNAATAEWTYEAERDLIACVKNTVNGNVISQYDYTHDALGRRVSAAKSGTMMAAVSENLAYGYNARSELVSAVSDVDANYNYAYAFDDIGNRKTASEAGTQSTYSANNLNQYTSITPSAEGVAEALTYDADGNATLIRTSTGTWQISYNAENRPVRWTNAETGTVITMTFDSQGRRTEYKSVTNGVQNTWLRFLYDGYLCIQVLYSNAPYNVFKEFVWDPTEPVATRPLVFRYAPNSLNLFYAFDGNKNVSDVFYRLNSNGIGAHYDYAPFGAGTRTHSDSSASFDIVSLNPFRFSSEYYDSELDLVYYNYRHYSPSLGRFLSRDPIAEQGGLNLYAFVRNRVIQKEDIRGLTLLYEERRVGVDEIWKIRIGSYALTIDGKTMKPDVAIPSLGLISTSKFLEEKKGSCFCAQIISAPKIEIHVLTLLPNTKFYKTESGSTYTFSDQAMSDLEGHEDRRLSVYRNVDSAFFAPVEMTGAVALKCGRICKKNKSEARYALEHYILLLQLEATLQAAHYIDEEQKRIGFENTGWDVDVKTHDNWEELYFKRLKPEVVQTVRPAIATWSTPCPESNS